MGVKENNYLNDNLVVRINKDDLAEFKRKSGGLGKPYQMMTREFVKAFNEGRLRITPTDEQKKGLKIYNQ